MTMRVGLALPQLGPHTSGPVVRGFAERAEELGFGHLFVQQHLFYPHDVVSGYSARPGLAVPEAYRSVLQPMELLAACAGWTSTMILGTSILVAGYHRPVDLAQRITTLDVLSGGRTVFGFSVGWSDEEHAQYDVDPRTRGRRADELIDAMKACWGPDPVEYHGSFVDIPASDVRPKPVQRPIPFYVGCFSETSMRMAAARGLHIIFAPFAAAMTFGSLGAAVRRYRELCVEAGRAPGRAKCSYFVHIAETPEEDSQGRQYLLDYFRHCVLRAFPSDPSKMPPSMHYFLKINDVLRGMTKESLTDKSILIGTPASIIDTLKRVEGDGIDEVILYFNVGRKPHALVQEQMHRFAEQVAPAFRVQ